MNVEQITGLVRKAAMHSDHAGAALGSGQYDTALRDIACIEEEYRQYIAKSTDETPEQKQPEDEQTQETTAVDCVSDEPHSEHCVST